MKERVIIDCDTGIDDALALVLALSRPELDIVGITTVAGNVDVENTTRNTCNVVHLLGRDDIRIAKGEPKPLEREPLRASGVHGVTGLRGYMFDSDWKENLLDIHAVEFMKRLLEESDEKTTIIAIGPVTNVAKLLIEHPEVKDRIRRIVFMGTSYHCGNPTPVSTFNVLVDPEAFRKVIFSGVEFVACPLEVTKTATIEPDEVERLDAMGTPVARFAASIIRGYGITKIGADEKIDTANEEVISENRLKAAKESNEVTMHDPATIAYVIDPSLFTTAKYYCDVECKGELTTGFTLIDKNDYYKKEDDERNLTLMESIDRPRFIDLFLDSVRRYG